MFSIPVYSGLKPAPNSNKADILPFISIAPDVCVITPVIIFNSVDFPDPFNPIIPTHSPFSTLKEIFCNA